MKACSMYKSVVVGLAITLIGYTPAYAAGHCNCNAKYHALKYTKHYYPSHHTMRVPSYRVPCTESDRDYNAEGSLYCIVITPIPGESQSSYDYRTIAATREYIALERYQWLGDMKKACGDARNLGPDSLSADASESRERYTETIAECQSAGF